MIVLCLVILTAVAALLAWFTGVGVSHADFQGLAVVYGTIAAAAILSMVLIGLLKGDDQAAATQAGMIGLFALMMISVGGLVGLRLAATIIDDRAISRWSPLLFLAALVMVTAEAVRAVRSAKMTQVAAKSGRPMNDSRD